MDIWALIPVKSLLTSKRRLSHLLTAEQRSQLIRGLLRQELNLLNQVPTIDEILVISSDPIVWDIARQSGALVEEEMQSLGLNHAVTQGTAVAAAHGAAAVLILPVDLPYISTADVDLVISNGLEIMDRDLDLPQTVESIRSLESQPSNPVMVICSDEIGGGTNALFVHPVQQFTFHFGPGSFHKHIQEAQKRGMIVQIVSSPGLSFDIDNENDWLSYQQVGADPCVHPL